jgi:hypothetical protein
VEGKSTVPDPRLEGVPSPRELVRAYRTLHRLSYATHDLYVRDMGGSHAWDGLVEGRRMLAVTTAALGQVLDPAYSAAWERMLDG